MRRPDCPGDGTAVQQSVRWGIPLLLDGIPLVVFAPAGLDKTTEPEFALSPNFYRVPSVSSIARSALPPAEREAFTAKGHTNGVVY